MITPVNSDEACCYGGCRDHSLQLLRIVDRHSLVEDKHRTGMDVRRLRYLPQCGEGGLWGVKDGLGPSCE
jgi:hypothetical protein